MTVTWKYQSKNNREVKPGYSASTSVVNQQRCTAVPSDLDTQLDEIIDLQIQLFCATESIRKNRFHLVEPKKRANMFHSLMENIENTFFLTPLWFVNDPFFHWEVQSRIQQMPW